MSQPPHTRPPSGPIKNPLGPPLDQSEVRAFFRRFYALSTEAQEAFFTKLNWNLVDFAVEARLFAWLGDRLQDNDTQAQVFALRTLDKLPHPKRARHASRFAALLPLLDDDLRARVADAFGPVLGGAKKGGGKTAGKPSVDGIKPAQTPEKAPTLASDSDLAKLKAFFDRSKS